MHAFLYVKQMVYEEAYQDWLEGGLRLSRSHKDRSQPEMGRVIRAVLAKHSGSFAEAYRADDL